ncbi:MAG TPA: DUF4136 domain-containing protein [Polyangiaceae bacterium]|nr:DUF4136 domain-containing protein [Polyangiaceae bacterium]
MRSVFPSTRAAVLSLVLAATVVPLLVACGSNVQVKTAFDKSKDFGRYRTFAMLEPNKPVRSNDPDVDPFVLQRLRQIIYARLLKRGYTPVAREQADMLVHVLAGVKERVELNSTSYYGYAWRGPAFGYTYDQYQEGTVVIDLIDTKENAVVWRGAGVRRVVSAPDNAELAEVVDRILGEFPPGAKE